MEAVLEAVGFLNDSQFTWFGVPSEALDPRVRRGLTPEAIQAFVRSQLEQTLYEQFYQKGSATAFVDDTHLASDNGSFSAALAAANHGKGSVEAGWTAREVRTGRIVVERQGLTLEVPPEICMPRLTETVILPRPIHLHVPSARPHFSPGYYLAAGAAPMPTIDKLIRLYWHLKPDGAINWVKCTTETLNMYRLPFQLKVLRVPEFFSRCDAGVLYLPRSAFHMARPALIDIYARVVTELRQEIPAFTQCLAPGLGLAESPASQSFGVHRCSVIAAGLIRSRNRGIIQLPDRMECVLAWWRDAGLQIERPYLNPGSQEIYEPLSLRTGAGTISAARLRREAVIEPSACLDVASEIAISLAREAIWCGNRCTWLGAQIVAPGIQSYGTLSADVYSGTAGLGIFLADLWKIARIKESREAAIGAIRQALAGIGELRKTNALGLYTGALGVCWATVRAALSMEETGLIGDAVVQLQACRDHVIGHIEQQDEWDLLNGQAGAILGLLWLRRILGDDSLLECAKLLGRALVVAGKRDRGGRLRWRASRGRSTRALTGYSHGAAGAGIALLELGAVLGDARFNEAGLAALAYEHRWYDAERANWPDFRRRQGERRQARYRFATAWCHGAPGIALSRLRAVRLAPSSDITSELKGALQTTGEATRTMVSVPDPDYCLCHGLTGNAEVLSVCSDGIIPPIVWRVATQGRGAYLLEGQTTWQRRPHLNGSPGLMLGRAGIGHFYLRLFDPSLQSVLLPYP